MFYIYIIGLLNVLSFLTLWFFSPLKTTISEIFLNKILMPHEFDDYVFSKNKYLGKLLSCWICMSFWLSLFTGLMYSTILGMPFYWGILCFSTYPSICYLFYIHSKQYR